MKLVRNIREKEICSGFLWKYLRSTVDLSDQWTVGPADCRTNELSDQWNIWLFKVCGCCHSSSCYSVAFICRTNGLSDQWTVGPMNCRTNGLSDQSTVWLFGYSPLVRQSTGPTDILTRVP